MLFPVLLEEYKEVISSWKSWAEVDVWGMFNQMDNKDNNRSLGTHHKKPMQNNFEGTVRGISKWFSSATLQGVTFSKISILISTYRTGLVLEEQYLSENSSEEFKTMKKQSNFVGPVFQG